MAKSTGDDSFIGEQNCNVTIKMPIFGRMINQNIIYFIVSTNPTLEGLSVHLIDVFTAFLVSRLLLGEHFQKVTSGLSRVKNFMYI